MKAETVYVKRHDGEIYAKLRVTSEEKMFPGLTRGFATDASTGSALSYRILCRAKASNRAVPVRVFMLDQNDKERTYLAVVPLLNQVVELACEMVDATGWVVASYKQMLSGSTGILRRRFFGKESDSGSFVSEIPAGGNAGGDSMEVVSMKREGNVCTVSAHFDSLERRAEQRHTADIRFELFNANLEEVPSKQTFAKDTSEGVKRTIDFKLEFDATDDDLYIGVVDGGELLPNIYAPLTRSLRERLLAEKE